MNEKLKIISLNIDHVGFDQCVEKVKQLGLSHTPSYICFANVHMIIEAYRDNNFQSQVNNATIVTADGKPVAAACKWLHGEKQEKWMADHSHKINAVLLGVGGAFVVTAGMQKRSAKWMQAWGLEWLHRLTQEPARLFKRYFITNTLFIWLLSREMGKKIFA